MCLHSDRVLIKISSSVPERGWVDNIKVNFK
jgi:hypothetical protein